MLPWNLRPPFLDFAAPKDPLYLTKIKLRKTLDFDNFSSKRPKNCSFLIFLVFSGDFQPKSQERPLILTVRSSKRPHFTCSQPGSQLRKTPFYRYAVSSQRPTTSKFRGSIPTKIFRCAPSPRFPNLSRHENDHA